jgi:protein FRG1
MVKPLSFKGDKKPKKRKRTEDEASTAAEAGSSKVAKAVSTQDTADDDSWVSADALGDVTGPVMFVLPSEPPTCLACDANGKVFTDPIVNIIDNNPATSEPHEVRQVWIANKIAGTENFRLKSRFGK